MTTPTPSPFHQNKNPAHPATAGSANTSKVYQIPAFTSFHNPKFKIQNPRVSVSTPYSCRGRERGSLTPSSLNPLPPFRPASGRVPQPRDSHIKTLRSSARFTETERSRAAFTLIELLAVITIIGILAGLTLGAAGAVRRHGASSTAKAEVAALQAACDRYFADNNSYPNNSAVNPSSSFAPTAYTAAGQVLFTNLLGSATLSVAPTTKRYFEPKPAMVNTTGNNYFIDPWGYAYGYNCSINADGTWNPPLIWSTAGQTTGGANTNKWITSWPKM